MFTFVKGFAYKFCFCLGLGTATYVSYGHVQKWVQHDDVKVIENVVEKHVTRENTVYDDVYTPQEFSYEQPAFAADASAPVTTAENQLAAAAPAEEKKEEEKKDENGEEKKDENGEQAMGGMLPSDPNAPMAYVPQAPQAQAPSSQEESRSTASESVPLASNVNPSPTPSSTPGASAGSSGGWGSTTNAVNTPSAGYIDASDVAALISPVKASFDQKTFDASGLLCTIGGHDCDRRNHVDVDTLRWGMNEGLKNSDVKFAIKATGVNSVEFEFDFKIQNTALREHHVSLTARPTSVSVQMAHDNAKNYRVIKFGLPDLTVSNAGENLTDVQAVMVYEVTPTGLVLASGSGLSFSRLKVQTLTTKWDPTEPGREPAQSGVFLIADELSFSMSLEKF